jgi:hypothetical protein
MAACFVWGGAAMHMPQNVVPTTLLSVGHAVCPRCGLRLEVVDTGERPEFRYDFMSWDSTCRSPLLGGPSACLKLQRTQRDKR